MQGRPSGGDGDGAAALGGSGCDFWTQPPAGRTGNDDNDCSTGNGRHGRSSSDSAQFLGSNINSSRPSSDEIPRNTLSHHSRSISAPITRVEASGVFSSSLNGQSHSAIFNKDSEIGYASPPGMAPGSGLLSDAQFQTWLTDSIQALPHNNRAYRDGTIEQNDLVENAPPLANPPKKRQLGIREYTNESSDLPTNNEILQHLAEVSCDSPSTPWSLHGHTYHDEQTYSFDALEAEVDNLKEEINRMKKVDRVTCTTIAADLCPTREDNSFKGHVCVKNPPRFANDMAVFESPAARLQNQHDNLELQRHNSHSGQINHVEHGTRTLGYYSNAADFPALNTPTPAPKSNTLRKDDLAVNAGKRQASYASILGTKIDYAETKPANTSTHDCKSAIPAPDVSGSMLDKNKPSQSVVDAGKPCKSDTSTIREDTSVFKSQLPLPKSKISKSSPHFAQPTQSFARRADATLKGRSTQNPTRPSEQAIAKSMRATDAESPTMKCSNPSPRKRKSIPGGWLTSSPSGPEVPVSHKASEKKLEQMPSVSFTGASDIPASKFDERAETVDAVESTTATSKSIQVIDRTPEKRHKKPPSYMAPTSVTLHRSAGNVLQTPPSNIRKHLASLNLINCNNSNYKAIDECIGKSDSFDEMSPTSESSSVVFILEKSNVDVSGTEQRLSKMENAFEKTNHTRLDLHQSTTPLKNLKQHYPAPQAQDCSHFDKGNSSANPSKRDRLVSFADVSKTTTTRRVSHGSILQPIVQCLDRHRLLSASPLRDNVVVQNYLENLGSQKSNKVLVNDQERQHDTTYRAQVNPTFRSKVAVVKPGSDVEHKSSILSSHNTSSKANPSETSQATLCDSQATLYSWQDLPGGFGHPEASATKIQKTPSLRATAKEFKPRCWHSEPVTLDFDQLSWLGALQYRSPEDWSTLPLSVKHSIQILRGFKSGAWGQNQTISGPQTQTGPVVSKAQARGGWDHISDSETGSTGTSTSPGWTLSDKSTPYRSRSTPGLSAGTSNRGWTINSLLTENSYAWASSNGREISFSGYGPYAERNTWMPVQVDISGRPTSYVAGKALYGLSGRGAIAGPEHGALLE